MPIWSRSSPGLAVDRGGQFAHPAARVVDDQDRQAGGGGALGARRVGQHGDGAEAGGLGGEVGAVQAGAGQGGVHVAGAHGAGVMGDAGDLGGARRRRGFGTQLIGQLRRGVGRSLDRPGRSRVCHGASFWVVWD